MCVCTHVCASTQVHLNRQYFSFQLQKTTTKMENKVTCAQLHPPKMTFESPSTSYSQLSAVSGEGSSAQKLLLEITAHVLDFILKSIMHTLSL